jgi:hypothetical protein
MLNPRSLNPRMKVVPDFPLIGSRNLPPQKGCHLGWLHGMNRSAREGFMVYGVGPNSFNFPFGKPPALPGDSKSLTFPGFDIL